MIDRAHEPEANTPKPDAAWARPMLVAPVLLLLSAALSYYFAGYRLPSADEGALLTNAAKLVHGGVFYRDVNAYPFPFASYLLAAAFALFGEHLSIARACAGLFFSATTVSLYAIALHPLDRKRAALFAAMLLSFKFLAYPSFTAYTYWDVSFCFGCIAILLLVAHPFRGATPRLAVAGLAVGLALVSKQNLGIYLGGVCGLLMLFAGPLLGVKRARPRELISELMVFGAASLLPFGMMAAYFATQGQLWTMIESGLLAPFIGYVGTSSVPFSVPLEWWNLGDLTGHPGVQYQPEPVWQLLRGERVPGASWYSTYWILVEIFLRSLYTTIPLAFMGMALVWLRSADRSKLRCLTVVGALAFGTLVSAFPRADYGHIISIYPIVGLILFALLARAGRWNALVWRTQVAAVSALLVLCASLTLLNHSYLTHRAELERASVWVAPQSWVESVVKYVTAELEQGDALFVYGQEAEFYFLTGHLFPWRFAQLYPGQAGGDGGRSLLEVLRREDPPLVIRGMMGWPGLPSLPDYVPHLDRYLSRRFRVEPEVFERYPLPEGNEAPPWWLLSMMRPCPEPIVSCDTWIDFAMRQPPLPFDPREVEQMERERQARELEQMIKRKKRLERRRRQRQRREHERRLKAQQRQQQGQPRPSD